MPQVCRWGSLFVCLLVIFGSSLLADDDLIASAPQEVRALLAAGGVTLDTYDPATQKSDVKDYYGSTTFELVLGAPYDTRYTWRRDGKWNRVAVETAFQPVRSQIKLKIKVPHPADRGAFWNESLVRHELDHVALSIDPRPVLLFERSLKRLFSLERKLPAKCSPKNSMVVGWIEQEIRLRRDAVYDLIRRQNQKLDEQTQHGAVALAARDDFFRLAYEKESLDEAAYPYFSDVIGLLDEKAYRETPRLHLPQAPQ